VEKFAPFLSTLKSGTNYQEQWQIVGKLEQGEGGGPVSLLTPQRRALALDLKNPRNSETAALLVSLYTTIG
jgi:hypothetical protein